MSCPLFRKRLSASVCEGVPQHPLTPCAFFGSLFFLQFAADIDCKGRSLTLATHQGMREFNEQSAATQKQIAATRADIQAYRIGEYRDKIIQWLSKTDPSYNHHQACKKHQPHTGEWLIKHVDFENWKTKKGFLLWLYGKRKSLPLVMLFPVRSGFNPLRCTLRFSS